MMWDIVRAILISYSIIVVLEYVLKAVFVQQSATSTRKMIEQKLIEQYKRYDEIGEDPLSVYGRGLPKRKGIGF